MPERPYLALGLEDSANKLGPGIIKHHFDGSTTVLSNVRHTYITPPGEGFLPQDTARHHREWIHSLIKHSLKRASDVEIRDLGWIRFTKGASQIPRAKRSETDAIYRTGNWCTPSVPRFGSQSTCVAVQQTITWGKSLCRTYVPVPDLCCPAPDETPDIEMGRQITGARNPVVLYVPVATPKLSLTRNSDTASSAKRLTLRLGIVWTDSLE